jgi:hypothetical protein
MSPKGIIPAEVATSCSHRMSANSKERKKRKKEFNADPHICGGLVQKGG